MTSERESQVTNPAALQIVPPSKSRITIRLDDDVLAWFREQAELAGGGSYQSAINRALREYIQQKTSESLEGILRRILQEELSGLNCYQGWRQSDG